MLKNYSELSDEDLLILVQSHSQEAFTELVSRHSRKFYALAYRMLSVKDIAEEIVQEAFMKLWHKPTIWNEKKKTKFTTWFYRIVLNLCLDRIKFRSRFDFESEALNIQGDSDKTEEKYDEQLLQKSLETWIKGLPMRQQVALNLVFYQGLSNKDAAKIMDIHLKALGSLLSRAKKSLKERAENFNLGDANDE